MIRFLSALVIPLCALSAHAKDTVVLCEKTDDPASELAFGKAVDDLISKGYELKGVGRTVKKSKETYVGTGLSLGMGPKGARVIAFNASRGSPAARTEMFGRHSYYPYVVRSINGISSIDMDLDEAANLIRGNKKVGTGVVLVLARHNTPYGEGREYARFIERKSFSISVSVTCEKIEITKQ